MKLSRIWELARENTTKSTDVVRQVSFAGIALIWVLRSKSDIIDMPMAIAGALLFLALALDLLQHLVTSWKYRDFAQKSKAQLIKQKVPNEEHGERDFPLPANFHRLAGWLFWAKAVSVVVAYSIIIFLLFKRFVFP